MAGTGFTGWIGPYPATCTGCAFRYRQAHPNFFAAKVRGLFAAGLLDDLVGNCLRDLGVAVERHGVHSAALGLRTQVTDVAEHAGQRNVSTDNLDALCIFHGLHLATAGVEVTDNFTHVFLRGADLDIHQRFEQNRVRLACSFLESHTAGDFERHFRGVNIVVRAVNQRGLDADNRVTGQDAVVQCILDTGVNRRDVLAGNAATGDLVLELVQLALGGVHRLDRDLDLCELTRTTGLLLVRVVVAFDGALDGFAVSNLGLAHVGFDLELAAHAVHQDVQVELAHAGDDGLAGVFVEGHLEGGVLSGELLDGRGELLLVTLGVRLDGNRDHGLREAHGLEHDLVGGVTQGVTRGGVLQTDRCVDVAGGSALNRHFLVGVHLEQLADALLLALGGVDHLRACFHVTGVHADEGELAEEGVCSNLEGQCGERLFRGRLAGQFLLFVARIVADHRGDVERVRQVVHYCIEHGLNATVLEG